jgi:hypothetical protein
MDAFQVGVWLTVGKLGLALLWAANCALAVSLARDKARR